MKKIIIYVILATLVSSCATSNQVVGDSFFVKRKYNKGFYVSSRKVKPTLTKVNEIDETLKSDELKSNQANQVNELEKHNTDDASITEKVEQNISTSNFTEKTKFEAVNRVRKKEIIERKFEHAKEKMFFKSQPKNTFNSNYKVDTEKDKNTEIIKIVVGLLLILFGFHPFGVLLVKNRGPEFRKSLILWASAYLLYLLAMGAIYLSIFSGGMVYVGLLLALAGFILFLISFVNAIITILN